MLGLVEKDIELPGATENTTAWGLLKLLVADRIVIVSGRIDAPLGAEPAYFGVKRDKHGRRWSYRCRSQGPGFNVTIAVSDNVEERASTRLAFSKANMGAFV